MLRLSKFFGALLCVVGVWQFSQAQCRSPKDDERPHGANEVVLIVESLVGQAQGRVFFPDYMEKEGRRRAKDIVIELYRYRGSASYEDVQEALRKNRAWACVTGVDGKFTFTGLKPGKYLLRAGTLNSDGFNETHIIFTHDPRVGVGKGLEIVLQPGT